LRQIQGWVKLGECNADRRRGRGCNTAREKYSERIHRPYGDETEKGRVANRKGDTERLRQGKV
jgi:hypothetical protein